ncbi:MAG: glutamate--tRNA ligase, partial [Actinomycetota bacterium]
GWSYDASTTFFTRDDLIEKFDLARVSHNPAAFDREKLLWMNGHYIREGSDDRVAKLLEEMARADGLSVDPTLVARAVPVVKERMHTIREGVEYLRFLFMDDVRPDEKAVKFLGDDRAEYLREVASRLEGLDEWRHDEIERVLRALQEEHELSSKQAFMPVRAAITGRVVTPPLFESVELLGRTRTLNRIRRAAGVMVED